MAYEFTVMDSDEKLKNVYTSNPSGFFSRIFDRISGGFRKTRKRSEPKCCYCSVSRHTPAENNIDQFENKVCERVPSTASNSNTVQSTSLSDCTASSTRNASIAGLANDSQKRSSTVTKNETLESNCATALACRMPSISTEPSVSDTRQTIGDSSGGAARDRCSVVSQEPPGECLPVANPKRRSRLTSLSERDGSRPSSLHLPSELGLMELRGENQRMHRDIQNIKLVLLKLRRLLSEDEWASSQIAEQSCQFNLQQLASPENANLGLSLTTGTPVSCEDTERTTTWHPAPAQAVPAEPIGASEIFLSALTGLTSIATTVEAEQQFGPEQAAVFDSLSKNLALLQKGNREMGVL